MRQYETISVVVSSTDCSIDCQKFIPLEELSRACMSQSQSGEVRFLEEDTMVIANYLIENLKFDLIDKKSSVDRVKAKIKGLKLYDTLEEIDAIRKKRTQIWFTQPKSKPIQQS